MLDNIHIPTFHSSKAITYLLRPQCNNITKRVDSDDYIPRCDWTLQLITTFNVRKCPPFILEYSVFVPLVAVKTKVETTCQATSTWRQLSVQIPFKHRFSFDITASHIWKKYHYHLI